MVLREKIEQLTNWMNAEGLHEKNLTRVFDMLNRKVQDKKMPPRNTSQFPDYYFEDFLAAPWHDPENYPWVSLLESNFLEIKKEALDVYNQHLMNIHPENDDLAGYGTWNTFFFYKNGSVYNNNLKRCPVTAEIISQIPGVDIAGRTYFSAMTPGIHIKPHCGPHNFKLRTHLGLVTPPEAVIRVDQKINFWPEGKCIVFDDSFEHEVWNKSQETRIVLILDVWNPILTEVEKKALEFIMPEFYQRTIVD